MCAYDDGNSVFRALFVMQNVGISGVMRTGGKKLSLKVPYLESLTPIRLFTMQLLSGYEDD